MEPFKAEEQTSQQSKENQMLYITTRVADIRVTGVVASSEQCDSHSSDDEVVEALSLCSPPDTCMHLLHFIAVVTYCIRLLFNCSAFP